MSDITKCININCMKKLGCYRFRAKSNKTNQSFSLFGEPDKIIEKCEYYAQIEFGDSIEKADKSIDKALKAQKKLASASN